MCVKINGQFTLTAMMVPLCISLTVILFTASRAIASDTNTTNKNIYYETRYIQDEKKAEALWLELNDQQYVNTSMTFSFAEATKALEQSNEKYKVYGLRRVQNISFDFLLFGETVRTVQLFANGLLMLAEQLYPKQLTEQPYFASVQPDFDLYPAEVVSFDFIRWFQNDSQLTVTWENMEFKPENSNFTFYTFQTTLFKTGDIVIVVKSITNEHILRNVTVTLMDGFILPNEAIHPYPHHSFKFVYENISNWSLIYMKPWPTCLNQKNLNSCLLPNRSLWAPDTIYDTNCSWCPSSADPENMSGN
uniref:Plexin domain-containing protein 2 n=1 Tax=Cacopsylla melanoneura TaxID=428564 RepID=A0A8D9BFR2_9HEMI